MKNDKGAIETVWIRDTEGKNLSIFKPVADHLGISGRDPVSPKALGEAMELSCHLGIEECKGKIRAKRSRAGITIAIGVAVTVIAIFLLWDWRQEFVRLEDENAVLIKDNSQYQDRLEEVAVETAKAWAMADLKKAAAATVGRERDKLRTTIDQERTDRIAAEVKLSKEQGEHRVHHLELDRCRADKDRLIELVTFEIAVEDGRKPAPYLFEVCKAHRVTP